MAVYSLSELAEVDLVEIYEYTVLNFDLVQAKNYLLGLDEHFKTLAANPLIGRNAEELAEGLRRFEYQSHVVFYTPQGAGVLIVRVLHESRDFEQHM